jgi:hypothetical protein
VSRTEAELVGLLDQAGQMSFGEAQTAAMEDVVRHADAAGYHRLAFAARRALADAYCYDRQWDKAFPLFARCLSEYDQRPGEYGPEQEWQLREWYAWMAMTMAEFPEITLAQVHGALDDVTARFQAGGHSLREVHAARRAVAQCLGEWDEEDRCYRLWHAAGGPRSGSVRDFEVEIERLLLRGDDASVARARSLAAPVLAGQRAFSQPSARIWCQMLLPLARTGELAQAAAGYRTVRRWMEAGPYRFEYSAMLHEFCALTGNAFQGLDDMVAGRLRGWYTLRRPLGRLRYATAVATLGRELVAAGLGGRQVEASGPGDLIAVAALGEQMRGAALDLAAEFDRRNGNTWQGDSARARMAAGPATAVPLKPTAQPPIRLAPVPAALPGEVLIERAEWHQRRYEPGVAWQHVAALGEVPSPVPPDGPVAGRAAQLRAVLGWGSGPRVGADLRHAADCLLRAGNQLRHLTCLCWLGAWHGERGDAAEATSLMARALPLLREADDHGWLAVAERLHALDLRRRKDRQAWPVLLSALGHAQAAGDSLAVGRVAITAAGWRAEDAPRPDVGYALMAKDAFHAAQAPAGVVRALDAARATFLKARAGGQFLVLIDSEIARLPPSPPSLLLGYLRLRRGLGLLAYGRTAQAADDLAFAVAEARTRGAEKPYDVFHLAVALHSLGWIQEAADELDGVPDLLDQARERGTLTDLTVADRAHALAGECYRRLGAAGLARREYDRLAATTTRPEQRAFALQQSAQILADQVKETGGATR